MSGTFRPYGLTVAHRAPLSMGFSRQEYWSGLSCPPPEDPPHPEIKSASLSLLHCQAGSLPLAPLGKAHVVTQLWSKPEERFLLAQFLLSGENPVPRPIYRITFAFSFWGCHIPSSETIIENEHRSTVIDGDWVRSLTSWPHQGEGEQIIKPGLFQEGRRREKVNHRISYTFPPTTITPAWAVWGAPPLCSHSNL